MTNERLTIDPNLEEVLVDIARQPTSVLRVGRLLTDAPATGVELFGTLPMAGRSSAENHLLRAHRCETARLLMEAYRAVLHDPRSPSKRFTHSDRSFLHEPPVPPETLHGQAELCLARCEEVADSTEELRLLLRCFAGDNLRRARETLVVSALRLERSDAALLFHSMELLEQDRLAEAYVTLHTLADSAGPTLRPHALLLRGIGSRESREYDSSLTDLARAGHLVGSWIAPRLAGLVTALAAADATTAIRIGDWLDDVVDSTDPQLDLDLQKLKNSWRFAPESVESILPKARRGETSSRVVDTLSA